jgi:adenylate kinase family enzyme
VYVLKNIFIGGVAKSGKSRLAKKICNNSNYNHIPVDYFASSFKHNFNEIGITSDVVINKKSSEKLALFLSRFIEIAESNTDEFFILDSAHIMPEDIVKYLDSNKWDVYYLGYPNMTAVDKCNELKEYVKDGWVQKYNEEELMKKLGSLIELSKIIQEQCCDYDIKFIDTSYKDVLDVYNL